jgi:hypothetical protein
VTPLSGFWGAKNMAQPGRRGSPTSPISRHGGSGRGPIGVDVFVAGPRARAPLQRAYPFNMMLLSGQSHNSIARQVGRAQSTVSELARREGIAPVNQAPLSAIERRKEFTLEARLEATGELMSKVLEIAATAKSGREIKECSVAWGVLCDKRAIMEGLPSSRTESRTTPGPGSFDLAAEFAKLDRAMEEEQERLEQERQEMLRHQEFREE